MPVSRTHEGWRVESEQRVSYRVQWFDGLLESERAPAFLVGGESRRRLVVVDANVMASYGDRLKAFLKRHGLECSLLELEVSEALKTEATARQIERALAQFGVRRRSEPVIAVGGGVLLDLVGYACRYDRGIPWVRIPTTLVGLVDAGIGVKTAVNADGAKHRLGTYHAGNTVLDRTFLATVDRRHIANGLAEVLKVALVTDRRLFELLEAHGRLLLDEQLQGRTVGGDQAAREVIERAVGATLDGLASNLWETVLSRWLDFGHTVSSAVEMRAIVGDHVGLLHGEAVALDMAVSVMLSRLRGLVTEGEAARAIDVMRHLELPTWHPLLGDLELLQRGLVGTVQHRDGHQRWPLPAGIGAVVFADDPASRDGVEVVTGLELGRAVAELRDVAGA